MAPHRGREKDSASNHWTAPGNPGQSKLQEDLDAYLAQYNESRPHQGRWRFGKTPMQTFLDSLPLAKEKILAA